MSTSFSPATIRACWKLHHRHATAAQHAAYLLLIGKDPRVGFTPIHNPVKLKNGQRPYQALTKAMRSLSFKHVADLAPWADLLVEAETKPLYDLPYPKVPRVYVPDEGEFWHRLAVATSSWGWDDDKRESISVATVE